MFDGTLFGIECLAMKHSVGHLNQQVLSPTPNATHSFANLLNLPIELKQNIALRLTSKDYASLRESCLKISQDIDSFTVLNRKAKLDSCPSEDKKTIDSILLNQSVRMMIMGNELKGISHVLKNIDIHKSNSSNDKLFISTIFSTRKCENRGHVEGYNHCPDWVENAFRLFKNEISTTIINSELIISQRKCDQLISWVVGVKFTNEFICYAQLKTVFINLNHVVNQTPGVEKLIIAVMANELKSHWEKNIPHGLVVNDIAESTREAKNLFSIAREVKWVLRNVPIERGQ